MPYYPENSEEPKPARPGSVTLHHTGDIRSASRFRENPRLIACLPACSCSPCRLAFQTPALSQTSRPVQPATKSRNRAPNCITPQQPMTHCHF